MRVILLLALLLPGCSWREARQNAQFVTEGCLSLSLQPLIPNAPQRFLGNGLFEPARPRQASASTQEGGR
jgi:hypothetical protein